MCFIFHKWEKWEIIREWKGDYGLKNFVRQRRRCSSCGLSQDIVKTTKDF